MRLVAEGKIPWAFWPEDTRVEDVITEVSGQSDTGLWIPGGVHEVERKDAPSDESEDDEEGDVDAETENEESSDAEDAETMPGGIGRFSALAIE